MFRQHTYKQVPTPLQQQIINHKPRMSDRLRAGSPTLFFIIRVLNLIFGLSAVALFALGIWLWRQFESFNIIEIVFITLGLFEILLVFLIWTAKKSIVKLRLFLFIMMILFIAQLSAVVITFAVGQKIVDQIAQDSSKEIQQLKKYLDIVGYYCAGSLGIMFFEIVFTYCYIGSLRNRNFEFDYKFLDEDGNKMTANEKVQYDREKVKEKYNAKRQELYSKYGRFGKDQNSGK